MEDDLERLHECRCRSYRAARVGPESSINPADQLAYYDADHLVFLHESLKARIESVVPVIA